MSTGRDLDREYTDNAGRQYAYDFDHTIRRFLLREVSPWIARDGAALEMGCYRGDMTEQILEYANDLTVMEGSGELAELVRHRFGDRIRVIHSHFEQAEPRRKFRTVFLVHALEHLDDPVAVLARTRDWLEEDGCLIVAVPNAEALSRQIAVKMGLVDYCAAVTPAEQAHGHRRTYSLDLLLAHIKAAGLRVSDYGGVIVKPLSNAQFDQALRLGVVSDAYVEACHELAREQPRLGASVFACCARD